MYETWASREGSWRIIAAAGITLKLRRRAWATACVPDPTELDQFWEAEWKRNIFETAVARVSRRVNPKHAQIFDLYALRDWPAAKVAQELGVNLIQVYLVNHRLSKLLKTEVDYVRKKLE